MHSQQRINPEEDHQQNQQQENDRPKVLNFRQIPIRHPFREEQHHHVVPLQIQVECPICCRRMDSHLLLQFCCQQHQYCKSCIVNMVQHGLNNFQIITCPQQGCRVQLNQKAPYYNKLKEADRLKWRKIARNHQSLQNPQIKLCRGQDCDGILKLTSEKIQCQLCKAKHCKKCLQIQHKGRCDTKQAQILTKKHRFKMCPNCKMIVQKNQGCDHITCYCSYEFCYLCNAEYRPYHKCEEPQGSCLEKMHQQLERQNSAYNSCLHCGKILEFLTPDSEYSQVRRYAFIVLFTLTIYPLIIGLMLVAALAILVFWGSILFIAFTLYVLVYPLVQAAQLELPPSIFLIQLGIPKFIVRILTIPLYPINLIFMIRRQILKLCATKIDLYAATHYMPFFMLLPCLLTLNISQDND